MAVYALIRVVVVVMAVPLVALASEYISAGSSASWLMSTMGIANDEILKAVSRQGDMPEHCCEAVINSCCCGSVGSVIYCTGKSESDQSSFPADKLNPIGEDVEAVLGAGLSSAGIAAGSMAANLMSASAVANGGGIAVGSLVAIAQSVGKSESDQSSFPADKLNPIAVGVGAVLGAVGLVVAAPVLISATGFTSAGIAAGSIAANLMSATAIANGGGIAVGSFVAIGQSIGAAGLGAAGTAVVAFVGSALGGLAGYATS